MNYHWWMEYDMVSEAREENLESVGVIVPEWNASGHQFTCHVSHICL